MILEQVWGPEWVEDAQTLRVHVSHLRKKIETTPGGPATSSPSRASAFAWRRPGLLTHPTAANGLTRP